MATLPILFAETSSRIRSQAKARILSPSYDEALRRTRHMLLEAQGYEVISTDRLESTLEQCKLGGFDLFVLGHSTRPEDKQEMVEAFRQVLFRADNLFTPTSSRRNRGCCGLSHRAGS
jgi:hypothetical protein